jgi:serine/threonine-protein phosphatase 6 regulatory ankyrin repeat subunit B
MEAAANGHLEIVQTFLEKKVDDTIKDNKGNTALMYASSGGHSDIVQMLLHREGSAIKTKDKTRIAMSEEATRMGKNSLNGRSV